jgi:hypothetical protein
MKDSASAGSPGFRVEASVLNLLPMPVWLFNCMFFLEAELFRDLVVPGDDKSLIRSVAGLPSSELVELPGCCSE